MSYTYDYPRPTLTVDCVLFGLEDEALKVLLIERARDPFAFRWALPGGFVDESETPLEAARRELEEETGLRRIDLAQFHTFGEPGRDPRGWCVSVAHWALVNVYRLRPQAADDARSVGWFPVAGLPPLAFDHEGIVRTACRRLRDEVRRRPLGKGALPRKFTLSESWP